MKCVKLKRINLHKVLAKFRSVQHAKSVEYTLIGIAIRIKNLGKKYKNINNYKSKQNDFPLCGF